MITSPVAIPFLSGLLCFGVHRAGCRPDYRGRNPFFIRSSLFRSLNMKSSPVLQVAIPFLSGLLCFQLGSTRRVTSRGRNPFFIRSSLFQEVALSFLSSEVAIPFLSGLLCFFNKVNPAKGFAPSQSLFYQVFFVSPWSETAP